jgi:hypothetical protein
LSFLAGRRRCSANVCRRIPPSLPSPSILRVGGRPMNALITTISTSLPLCVRIFAALLFHARVCSPLCFFTLSSTEWSCHVTTRACLVSFSVLVPFPFSAKPSTSHHCRVCIYHDFRFCPLLPVIVRIGRIISDDPRPLSATALQEPTLCTWKCSASTKLHKLPICDFILSSVLIKSFG